MFPNTTNSKFYMVSSSCGLSQRNEGIVLSFVQQVVSLQSSCLSTLAQPPLTL